VAAEPGFDRVRSFKEKDEEKLAREARKKKFAGERIGEAKNPGPNYWRRPCWWGADCQWHKEGRCQFWHGETLGNSDEPVGKTAEWQEHAQEQEEKEEPPWWAKQLILDNARLSWQVAELSEDNALLRQKVEDLTEVVKSIWETGDSGKTEEGVGNAAQSSMERHALDAEDASGKTEKGAGNTAQTVRDEQSDTVGNAAQSSKERHALDAEDASGKTEEGAGNTAQTVRDEQSDSTDVESWLDPPKTDIDDAGNSAEVNQTRKSEEKESEEKESELTEEEEHFNNVLTQVLEGDAESLAACSTRVLMDVERVSPGLVEAGLKERAQERGTRTIPLAEWLHNDKGWKHSTKRKGKGKGKGKTLAKNAH